MAQQQTPIAVDASELSDTPQTPVAPVSKPAAQSGQKPIPVDAQELSNNADPFSSVGGKAHIDLNNLIGPQLPTAEKLKRDPGLSLRDKIREIENYTMEGRQTHPILAKVGDFLRNVYVPGGESVSTPTTEQGPGWAQAKPLSEMSPQEQEEYLNAHPPLASPLPPPVPGMSGTLESVAQEGAARTAAAAAAAPATEAAPGLAKQLIQGKQVAQAPANEALRNAASSAAESAGVSTVPPAGLRSILEDPINSIEAQSKANYRAMDEVTGGKFQPTADALKNVNEKLRAIAGTNDVEEANLQASKTRLEWQQERLFDEAAKNGVPKTVVENARSQFRQAQALRDLESKVFKNPSNISGNAASGTAEGVRIGSGDLPLDNTVKALQKMADNREWGTSRLEQALGSPESAKDLLDDMYAAQRLGVKAMSRQKLAERIGIGLGSIGGLYEVGKAALARGK